MLRIFFSSIISAFLFISTVSAQVELDQSFGTNGKREVNFSAIISIADLIIQPDSKMIFTSSCTHFIYASGQFCVVRREEDGSPDLTFNPAQNGGFNLLNVGGFSGASNSLMLQSDGKIIAAGSANINNFQ
nr:hypothetical protein [Pyrinomonadaceae bacterium]